MLKTVLDDRRRWFDLFCSTETPRGKIIDDRPKCVVVLPRSPAEFRDHSVLQSASIADKLAVMSKKTLIWKVTQALESRQGRELRSMHRQELPGPLE